ncbi:MAG: hypothetical protein HYZ75_00265 [Elusimicrobia bacterium]|nr:hypothetical protein [Elusimicrobiota bacterium]
MRRFSLLLPLLLLAVPGSAKNYSEAELRKLVGGQSGPAGPYAIPGLKVILENGFEYHPWQYEQAGRIKNQYGLQAFRVLAENYNEISEGVLGYCAEIDNQHGVDALKALAEKYAVLYAWQARWSSEVHTSRESGAYRRVVRTRHTEKEEAEAALLDGLRSETTVRRERSSRRREVRTFQGYVRTAVSGLPAACRNRLSGADVVVRDWPEYGVAEDAIVRFKDGIETADPDQCSGARPARMTVYWGPFYNRYLEGGPATLKRLISGQLGCRPVARVARVARVTPLPKRLYARAPTDDGELRDALSAPLKKAKRFCKVVKYKAPRVVVESETVETTLTTTIKTTLITEGMERNVAEPSRAKVESGK